MIPALTPPVALRRWYLRREIAALENSAGRNTSFHSLHTAPFAPGLLLSAFAPGSDQALLFGILLLLAGDDLGALLYLWGRETRALLHFPGLGHWRSVDLIARNALLHQSKAELAVLTADATP